MNIENNRSVAKLLAARRLEGERSMSIGTAVRVYLETAIYDAKQDASTADKAGVWQECLDSADNIVALVAQLTGETVPIMPNRGDSLSDKLADGTITLEEYAANRQSLGMKPAAVSGTGTGLFGTQDRIAAAPGADAAKRFSSPWNVFGNER